MDDATQWERVGKDYATRVPQGVITVARYTSAPEGVTVVEWMAYLDQNDGGVRVLTSKSTLELAQEYALYNAAKLGV